MQCGPVCSDCFRYGRSLLGLTALVYKAKLPRSWARTGTDDQYVGAIGPDSLGRGPVLTLTTCVGQVRPAGAKPLRFHGIIDEQDEAMASGKRSVDLPGMAQAQKTISEQVDLGNASLKRVDSDRMMLASHAYKSDGGASRALDSAVLSWENQLSGVLRALEDFDAQLGTARTGYSRADSDAAEQTQRLQSSIGLDGL
jgi:hypothetical protein